MQATLLETTQLTNEQKTALGFESAKKKLLLASEDDKIAKSQLKAIAVWLLVQEPLYFSMSWSDSLIQEATDIFVEDVKKVKEDIIQLFRLVSPDEGNLQAWLSKFRRVQGATKENRQLWKLHSPKTFNRNLNIKEVHLGVHLKGREKKEKAALPEMTEVSPGFWIRKDMIGINTTQSQWTALLELQKKSVEELQKKTAILQEIDRLDKKRKAVSAWVAEENSESKRCRVNTFNNGHTHAFTYNPGSAPTHWAHCQLPTCGQLVPIKALKRVQIKAEGASLTKMVCYYCEDCF